MIQLAFNKIQKYYGATMVLQDITFEVHTAERIGIVGGNGCGKSTLLKIMMGMESYDKGTLAIRKGATLGYLEQLQIQMHAFLEQQKKIKGMEKSIAQLRDWGIRADNNKFFKRAASMRKLEISRVVKEVD